MPCFKHATQFQSVLLQVLRPWCHFELPESDYVTGGRRNPDLPGPSGVIELLDPATKVMLYATLSMGPPCCYNTAHAHQQACRVDAA